MRVRHPASDAAEKRAPDFERQRRRVAVCAAPQGPSLEQRLQLRPGGLKGAAAGEHVPDGWRPEQWRGVTRAVESVLAAQRAVAADRVVEVLAFRVHRRELGTEDPRLDHRPGPRVVAAALEAAEDADNRIASQQRRTAVEDRAELAHP